MIPAPSFKKVVSVSTPPRSNKSIFAIILDALHRSRRLQAQRAIRHYRDLVDQAQHSIVEEKKLRSAEPQPFRNESAALSRLTSEQDKTFQPYD